MHWRKFYWWFILVPIVSYTKSESRGWLSRPKGKRSYMITSNMPMPCMGLRLYLLYYSTRCLHPAQVKDHICYIILNVGIDVNFYERNNKQKVITI